MADQLTHVAYFPSNVYMIKLPQYLEVLRAVSAENMKVAREAAAAATPNPLEEIYPVSMTGTYANDPRVQEFAQYVSRTAWNILQSQGANMQPLFTVFMDMWTQEHRKGSSMDTHIHPHGAHITAFYFLDCPENGCQIGLHDPRPGKVATTLPPVDMNQLSDISEAVYLRPEEGMLLLTNSWLPHSFTRNASDDPCRFIHMNLGVVVNPNPTPADGPEVI